MASCDIQIVNPNVLERIESFMADASYREAIENSSNYNTRLCVERRLRMPFLDSQTGVAQNHSNLFMAARERIPGLHYGQVYTYPSKRWRKKRRQYLMQPQVGLRRCEVSSDSGDLHTISTVENPAAMSEDSKDSAGLKDDAKSSDAWYYDEFELQSMEGFDEQDPDSDYDYEESYSKRKRKGRGGKTPGRGSSAPSDSPHPKKGKGRGRKKGINYAETGDSEKPFSCDRPPAKRGRPSAASQQQQRQQEQQRQEQQRQQEQFEDAPTPATSQALKDKPPDNLPEQVLIMEQNEKPRATPSPYCDFCLGDAVSNKKSGQPEELVSCSDCGRSGHPTCLLFTKNMIVSVRKYRWQCIECKCCSICGTSDNDDQLLFCDDCDRGYHMYCLVPPLQTPPEGSWSCRSCIRDFH